MQESVTVSHPASVRINSSGPGVYLAAIADGLVQSAGYRSLRFLDSQSSSRGGLSAKGLKSCDPSVEAKQHP